MSNNYIRQANITRKTNETDISLKFVLDGFGDSNINTGIGFLTICLSAFAKHGLFNLDIKATGDLIVDCHHTIEDVGIVLGEAIKKSIGDKNHTKIWRYYLANGRGINFVCD